VRIRVSVELSTTAALPRRSFRFANHMGDRATPSDSQPRNRFIAVGISGILACASPLPQPSVLDVDSGASRRVMRASVSDLDFACRQGRNPALRYRRNPNDLRKLPAPPAGGGDRLSAVPPR
jgi:hypothetical protein